MLYGKTWGTIFSVLLSCRFFLVHLATLLCAPVVILFPRTGCIRVVLLVFPCNPYMKVIVMGVKQKNFVLV